MALVDELTPIKLARPGAAVDCEDSEADNEFRIQPAVCCIRGIMIPIDATIDGDRFTSLSFCPRWIGRALGITTTRFSIAGTNTMTLIKAAVCARRRVKKSRTMWRAGADGNPIPDAITITVGSHAMVVSSSCKPSIELKIEPIQLTSLLQLLRAELSGDPSNPFSKQDKDDTMTDDLLTSVEYDGLVSRGVFYQPSRAVFVVRECNVKTEHRLPLRIRLKTFQSKDVSKSVAKALALECIFNFIERGEMDESTTDAQCSIGDDEMSPDDEDASGSQQIETTY